MSEQTIGIGTRIYKPIDTIEKSHFFAECAAWCNENRADLVEYEEYCQIEEHKRQPLPELKTSKLEALNTAHEAAETEAHIKSSLGFTIDANDRANRDISGLLITTPEEGTVNFCDYNNEMHQVTKSQLIAMQNEIIQNAQYLYSQKWTLRASIEAAQSQEELDKININFIYKDFSSASLGLKEVGI